MRRLRHWIFAPTYTRARHYARDTQQWDGEGWCWATREGLRGVSLDSRQTIHILDGFDDEELERVLSFVLLFAPLGNTPQIIDLRKHFVIPDLTDLEAVEAWLNS